MTVSAHDVARELRRRLPGAGVVKVHKLLYYCQGWHLAWTGKPMFDEPIEAWTNGPVVADLWADEKYTDRQRPEPTELDSQHLGVIGHVVSRYGSMTGKQLIVTTHAEDPWRSLSESDDGWIPASPRIPHDALQKWFEQVDRDELTPAERHVRDVVLPDLHARGLVRTDVTPGRPDDRSRNLLRLAQLRQQAAS